MKSSTVPIIFSTPKEFDKIQVFCCSDMHNGSAQFNEKAWFKIEELLKVPTNYVIFAGDQCEFATRTSKSDISFICEVKKC